MDQPSGSSGVDVEAVMDRVVGCRSVARLAPGRFPEVATYLPGRRVPGVRLLDDRVEIHVVACWGVPIPELATEVRRAVGPVAAGLAVDVHVADIDVPDGGDAIQVYLPDSS